MRATKNRVRVISLDDRKAVRSVFSKIGHTSSAHLELRRKIFQQVSQSAKLQRLILKVLGNQFEVQRALLLEVAKNPSLLRKLVKLVGKARNS